MVASTEKPKIARVYVYLKEPDIDGGKPRHAGFTLYNITLDEAKRRLTDSPAKAEPSRRQRQPA